jgi:protein subunit release factor A
MESIQEEIVEVILPNTEAENLSSCTLEIMQAAGGSESSLFAEDILLMYKNYCRNNSFRMKEEQF